MIEFREHITRQMLRDEPDTLFVFGDNMERRGLGGQAAEMRDEPNAVGIPTKRAPHMGADAFLRDSDYAEWIAEAMDAWHKIATHSGLVVWPTAGIGTGRAQLERRAPRIWASLEVFKLALVEKE